MRALLIVDLQNDFMPGGALGVPNADQIVSAINALIPKFPLVLATQDWHPSDHTSFVSNHPGKKVGDVVDVKGIAQILWPVHCVRSTHGAELVPALHKENISALFYKGTDKWIDSYSAFFDNARKKSTGLTEYLKTRDIRDIYIVGVATDYCVLYSALDALECGLNVTVISDVCRGIALYPGDVDAALQKMREKGINITTSNQIT